MNPRDAIEPRKTDARAVRDAAELTEQADASLLVLGGPLHLLAKRVGLTTRSPGRQLVRVVLYLAVTWIPLLSLSFLAGHVAGQVVHVPFLFDPEVHARLLFVLPLLELGGVSVAVSLKTQTRHLLDRGVVPEAESSRYNAALCEAVALRTSPLAEILILLTAYAISAVLRLNWGFSEGDSSWERHANAMTAAGWWYALVSLPILYFFLLRWLWVFLVWGWFLHRVSRLELALTPTHPDRAGGLGFLGWGMAGFAPIVMAISAVCSAGFADEILHRGASLDDLKYHVIVFVIAAIIVMHAPLFNFAFRLARCRFVGLLEFGALVWRHDRAFDQKWIKNRGQAGEELLGNADVQSLAAIAACYQHVNETRLVPFDTKALAVLAVAAALPMAPLLGAAIPLGEMLQKLAELVM